MRSKISQGLHVTFGPPKAPWKQLKTLPNPLKPFNQSPFCCPCSKFIHPSNYQPLNHANPHNLNWWNHPCLPIFTIFSPSTFTFFRHHGDPSDLPKTPRLPPLQPQLPTQCLRPEHPGAALPRHSGSVGATSVGRSGGSTAERGAHGETVRKNVLVEI